jgi:hypothetical protein
LDKTLAMLETAARGLRRGKRKQRA